MNFETYFGLKLCEVFFKLWSCYFYLKKNILSFRLEINILFIKNITKIMLSFYVKDFYMPKRVIGSYNILNEKSIPKLTSYFRPHQQSKSKFRPESLQHFEHPTPNHCCFCAAQCLLCYFCLHSIDI